MKTKTLRKIQLFWGYFIGIGAVVGFLMMMIDPNGTIFMMKPLLPVLQEAFSFAPALFQNFIPSGIVLLLVNGIPNFISVYLIHKRSKYSALSGLICGIILLLWIILEFIIWGFPALSVIYGVFALLQIANAAAWIGSPSVK